MPHPDFAVPPAGYYAHGLHSPIEIERARGYARALESLTAAPPAAVPADRPAMTLGASGCLTPESPEPATDLSGRVAR